MKHIFYSEVKNGILQKNASLSIKECLSSFEGKRVQITIEKKKKTRSNNQNRYIHAIFNILTVELNRLGNDFSKEEIKELCKAKFSLMDVLNESTGEIIGQRIKGTSEMTTVELNCFIENIIRWSAEMFSIVLPYPNEVLEIKFDS